MNLYIVLEHNGEQWEGDYSWPVAAFDDKSKAEEYAKGKTKSYEANFEVSIEQGKLKNTEYESLSDANPYTWDTDNKMYHEVGDAIWEYLQAKYPNAVDEWESQHYFTVTSNTIPLNPSI